VDHWSRQVGYNCPLNAPARVRRWRHEACTGLPTRARWAPHSWCWNGTVSHGRCFVAHSARSLTPCSIRRLMTELAN
jgi:hypothetical protein